MGRHLSMFALTQVWHNIWQIVCCCLLLSMSMTFQHLRHFIRDLKITWVIWRDTSQTTTKMLLFSSWLWSHYLFFFLNQRSKKYYICVFFYKQTRGKCSLHEKLRSVSVFIVFNRTNNGYCQYKSIYTTNSSMNSRVILCWLLLQFYRLCFIFIFYIVHVCRNWIKIKNDRLWSFKFEMMATCAMKISGGLSKVKKISLHLSTVSTKLLTENFLDMKSINFRNLLPVHTNRYTKLAV